MAEYTIFQIIPFIECLYFVAQKSKTIFWNMEVISDSKYTQFYTTVYSCNGYFYIWLVLKTGLLRDDLQKFWNLGHILEDYIWKMYSLLYIAVAGSNPRNGIPFELGAKNTNLISLFLCTTVLIWNFSLLCR